VSDNPYILQRYAQELVAALFSEGIHKTYINKVVFVVGGTNCDSGQEDHLLSAFGLKRLNSDHALEYLLNKEGMHLDMTSYSDDTQERKYQIRDRAKEIAAAQEKLYAGGNWGIAIDARGKDYEKVRRVREEFVNRGYDIFMVFVNTALKRELAQNAICSRRLPEQVVTEVWEKVITHIGKFFNLFGYSHSLIVDNNGEMSSLSTDDVIIYASHCVQQFLDRPVTVSIKRHKEFTHTPQRDR